MAETGRALQAICVFVVHTDVCMQNSHTSYEEWEPVLVMKDVSDHLISKVQINKSVSFIEPYLSAVDCVSGDLVSWSLDLEFFSRLFFLSAVKIKPPRLLLAFFNINVRT